MKVTGTWKGEYTYGPDYGELTGRSVPFTMSLSESWLGRMTGYVRDDAERGGEPERGKVSGKRRSDRLEFVKTMPKHYWFDGALHPVHEYAQQHWGLKLDPNPLPHEIHYVGALSADGATAAGEWKIPQRVWDTDQGLIQMPGGSGTWTARKVSDEVSAV